MNENDEHAEMVTGVLAALGGLAGLGLGILLVVFMIQTAGPKAGPFIVLALVGAAFLAAVAREVTR